MSLWIPESAIIAELTMKLEAANFQKQKLDYEIEKNRTRLAQLKGMSKEIMGNLEFLRSPRARIIALTEYAMAKKNLTAMAAEMEGCEKFIFEYEQAKVALDVETDRLAAEIKNASFKILEFKKRG